MQRLMVYLLVIGLFLAACSPPAGPVSIPTEVVETPADPTGVPPTDAPDPAEVPAASAAVRALAALLGLKPELIKVISVEAVEWTDSCLGIVYIDAICAQGIVPGYRIILEANGQRYEYHTNEDGASLAIAPATVENAAEAAAQAVRAALARALGLPEYRVTVVSYAPVEWPDSCLGITRIDAICALGIVPGYRIIAQANGQLVEYHTDADGTALAVAAVSADVAAEGAVQAALAALAEALGLAADQISVVSVAAVEWPDACLGIVLPGVACAEAITPGFNVVLEANEGQLYEYHTNQDGANVRPASLALTWQRNGGIAGFCDELLVYRSGEVVVRDCKNENVKESTLAAAVSAGGVAQFSEWLAQYGAASVQQSDGAVADSMTVLLSFTGVGAAEPDEAAQQALLEWAQNLYAQVQPAS